MKLLYKDEVYAIIGAAMDVYNNLGQGFLEPAYQEAMEIELLSRNIPALPEQKLLIQYKGVALKKYYEADLICYGKIIVEIKALDKLTSREESQLLNYLKATSLPVGLLINFGAHNDLEWKRMVATQTMSRKSLAYPRPPQINDPKTIRED